MITASNVSLSYGTQVLFKEVNIKFTPGNCYGIIGANGAGKSTFLKILSGEIEPDEGEFSWGVTTSLSYFPKDNSRMFKDDESIADYLQQFSKEDDDTYVRSFLGRMLFSGDEALKNCKVLSGGERVRVVLAKMMLEGANCLIFDEPTSHLDLEAIQSLNNALIDFKGVILFNSHDHQFVSSIANRIIEFTPDGIIDRMTDFESYIGDEGVKAIRDKAYAGKKQVVVL